MTLPLTDARLRPLADALALGQYDVLSVDIFDTLLWRRVPQPKDLFYVLGQSLIDNGIVIASLTSVEFTELRVSAENAARAQKEAQSGSREVLLTDIYAELPTLIWSHESSKQTAMEAEVNLEANALVVDHEVVALIETARSANANVILTSDTYFTRQQLMSFFKIAGLGQDQLPETLYISNEHSRPKWLDLFDVVLQELKVNPVKMVHVGDSLEADVAPCIARGIAYLFYNKWDVLPRTQNNEFPVSAERHAQWLCSGGEGGLTGLRSRLGHRAPADLSPEHLFYWVYGAVHLAPIFAAYGHWVLDTVKASSYDTLYGIMREGRFLNRVVSAVAKETGKTINTKELWLSRRSVVRAALWTDDFSQLAEAITYCPGPTTDDVLRQLGLCRSDLAITFKDPEAFELHAPDGFQALLIAISSSQKLQEKIASESQARRDALLTHISRHTDFSATGQLHLMDLGYAGTIQTALHKIFQREKVPLSLTGLYMAINEKGRKNRSAGADLRALYSDDELAVSLVGELERTPDVLEHACMCEDGSLETFDHGGVPVFLENQRNEAQLSQMKVMQDGIVSGVIAITDLCRENSPTRSSFILHAGEILRQAILRPTLLEAETIGGWLHEANFDISDRRELAELRTDPAKLELGEGAAWLNIERHEAYWPAAALKRAAPHLSEAAASLRETGKYKADKNYGALLGTLLICPDIGVGFDERRQLALPLVVSPDGCCDIGSPIKSFGAEAFESLRISLPRVSSDFNIENCAVIYRGEGEKKEISVINDISYEGSVEVHDNFNRIQTDEAYLVVSLGSLTPNWPHALDLRLRMTYLRIDRLL